MPECRVMNTNQTDEVLGTDNSRVAGSIPRMAVSDPSSLIAEVQNWQRALRRLEGEKEDHATRMEAITKYLEAARERLSNELSKVAVECTQADVVTVDGEAYLLKKNAADGSLYLQEAVVVALESLGIESKTDHATERGS